MPDTQQRTAGHVLVADDDPIFRSLMVRRITQLGADPLEAEDGSTAWHIVSGRPVDLALVDLDMPGLNGFELINCIRGHRRTRHVPVVVITSRSDSQAVQEALAAGATAYLTKPLVWSTFSDYVRHLLSLSLATRRANLALVKTRRFSAGPLAEFRDDAQALAQRFAVALAEAPVGPPLSTELQSLCESMAKLVTRLDAVLPAVQQTIDDAEGTPPAGGRRAAA